MSAIGKGDWVECIRNASGDRKLGIQVGNLYCVEDARPQRSECGWCNARGAQCDQIGLLLAGVRCSAPGYKADYLCSRAFKPIYRPSESLFLELLMDVPASSDPVGEPA